MKDKRIVLLIIIGAFVLLMVGASVLYRQLGDRMDANQLAIQTSQPTQQTATAETEYNNKAPDFVVYDREGNAVHLYDYVGKPIVLNFWASWCGPCQMEMPDFQEKYLDLGGDVHFLMVNMTDGLRETVETASAFVEEKGYTFPVFYDSTSDAAYTYGAYSLPTTFFIDADGYAIAQATGALDAQTLQKGIDLIQ